MEQTLQRQNAAHLLRMIGERDALAVSAATSTLSAELEHRATAIQLVLRASKTTETLEEVLASSVYLMIDFDRGIALIFADGQLLDITGAETCKSP